MQPICVSLRTQLDFPANEVFDWQLSPSAFERLIPPWIEVKVLSKEGGPHHVGSRLVVKIKAGPFWVRFCFQHVAFEEEHYFTDVQMAGPFRFWKHVHKVHNLSSHTCEIVDEIQFIPPLGLFPHWVKKRIERALRWRHERIKAELRVLTKYQTPPLKILVSGSSGFIGRHLVAFLQGGGHDVYRLVRKRGKKGEKALYWNPKTASREDFEGFDAVIHLAGKNIGQGIWSEKFKRAVFSSRVEGTRVLAETLSKLQKPLKVFICASALGFYGNRREEELTEASGPGKGFLALVCQEWEKAAERVQSQGTRLVSTRFGLVLSPSGGMLKKVLPLFKMGLGSWFGSGEQWVSWIALEDVVYGIYHTLLTQPMEGPVNFCSPEPIRARPFFKALADALNRPLMVHVGEKWCKRLLGEMADEMLLTSQKTVPQKLMQSGYSFQYRLLKQLFSAVLKSSGGAD